MGVKPITIGQAIAILTLVLVFVGVCIQLWNIPANDENKLYTVTFAVAFFLIAILILFTYNLYAKVWKLEDMKNEDTSENS